MEQKRKGHSPLTIIALVLSIVSISMLCWLFFGFNTPRHILYIGTNDKGTLRAEITVDEARAVIAEICSRYGVDYTILDAKGVWTNAAGEATSEDTLLLIVYGASPQTISAVCGDIAPVLNQESILVERAYAGICYFDGSRQ